jgi:hypothetical protein
VRSRVVANGHPQPDVSGYFLLQPDMPVAADGSFSLAVAPGEHVWTPLLTSSLFPHLPQSYRKPFRVGMLILLAGLISSALLRLLGPLVIIAALGVPLLFVLYLWQSGLFRDMPGHALLIAATVGGALGVGWVLLTGGVLARAYGIPERWWKLADASEELDPLRVLVPGRAIPIPKGD